MTDHVRIRRRINSRDERTNITGGQSTGVIDIILRDDRLDASHLDLIVLPDDYPNRERDEENQDANGDDALIFHRGIAASTARASLERKCEDSGLPCPRGCYRSAFGQSRARRVLGS